MSTPPDPQTQQEEIAKRLGIITPAMINAIDDQVEFNRYQNIMFRMLRRKPFFASLIGRMRVHTGRAAIKYAPTACVWVGQDLQVHLAVNPFYMNELQRERIQRGQGSLDPTGIRALVKQGFTVFLPADSTTPEIDQILEKNNEPTKFHNEWLAIKINHDSQVALLIHECLHVIHLHLLQGSSDHFPDQQLTNIAMDIAINQFIADRPEGWLDQDTYKPWGLELEPNKDFSAYYHQLIEFWKNRKRGDPPPPPPPPSTGIANPVQGLLHGTQISTPKGTTPIQRLGPGDTVYTLDASGKLVQRTVWHKKASPMVATANPKILPTSIFSLRTSAHGLARVSSKVKVHSTTRGWVGIGESTAENATPLILGEEISTYPDAVSTEPVSDVAQVAGRDGDRLYQLLVDPGDSISSFFANGILVRGLQPIQQQPMPMGDTP